MWVLQVVQATTLVIRNVIKVNDELRDECQRIWMHRMQVALLSIDVQLNAFTHIINGEYAIRMYSSSLFFLLFIFFFCIDFFSPLFSAIYDT